MEKQNRTHNTRYKQVGQKAKIKTVLYLEEKFKTEKNNLLTPNLRVARERCAIA